MRIIQRLIFLILFPFSLLYGMVLFIRNKCYDWNLFFIGKVKTPIISVGNLSVGGTGKTPHVNHLIGLLKSKYHLGIISRGYGRSTKGIVFADEKSTSEQIGDEMLFYKQNHKSTISALVAENRFEGAKRLEEDVSDLGLIILDDAFQHRSIYRDLDIVLVHFDKPFWRDFVLPSGRLREFTIGKNRADVFIVTNAPNDINDELKYEFINKINPNFRQAVFFSKVKYLELVPFGNHNFNNPKFIILVTGIANPKPLQNYLSEIANVKLLEFNDHYDFSHKDIVEIHELFDTFAGEDVVIVTTEKDFQRLNTPEINELTNAYPWFYQKIGIEIENEKELLNKIENVIKNKRSS